MFIGLGSMYEWPRFKATLSNMVRIPSDAKPVDYTIYIQKERFEFLITVYFTLTATYHVFDVHMYMYLSHPCPCLIHVNEAGDQ